jgi:NTE family protein
MATNSGAEPAGLVLAGGGARGAYEVGALSELLPRVDEEGHRPTVLVGNSVGAINAMFLAAGAHLPVQTLINDGIDQWSKLTISDVIRHVISPGIARRLIAYLGEVLGWPRARLWSLLDTAPLEGTIPRIVDFDQIAKNRTAGVLQAAGAVATSAQTRQSVVFHNASSRPVYDTHRLIHYAHTEILVEHVLASAAIPAVFPAREVLTPAGEAGWYIDGGTRLNTPIKPALELGARRVIVIGLASLNAARGSIAGLTRPDALAGVGQIVYGLLADRVAQDVHTLARGNETGRRQVPYIFVAPEHPEQVEELARRVFLEQRRGLWQRLRPSDLELVGRITGVTAAEENATLLSLLLFQEAFIREMMNLGANDARRWLAQRHDDGIWQVKRL